MDVQIKNIQVKESVSNKLDFNEIKDISNNVVNKIQNENTFAGLFKGICYKLYKNTLILF